MWTLLVVALSVACVQCSDVATYENDNKIDEAATIERENLTTNVFVLPEQIFNDGKPFYVKKDPISGTLDYTAKTTPESLPVPTSIATEPEIRPTNQTIDISSTISTITSTASSATNSTSNTVTNNSTDSYKQIGETHDIVLNENVRGHTSFHDFLPVKYQSSKFVYPLVSSSYANLKYQGNNKNFLSNHKPDSSTKSNVPYALSHTKKYKTTYPTKSFGASSTVATATDKKDTVHEFDSATRSPSSPLITTRRYANIPSRGSSPERRYTTLSRATSTTQRAPVTNSYENKFNRRRSTTTSTSPSPLTPSTTTTTQASTTVDEPKKAVPSFTTILSTVASSAPSPTNASNVITPDDNEKEESMNFGDFFSYFFNNENNDESKNTAVVPTGTTIVTPKPILTTSASVINTVTTSVIPPTQRPFVSVTTSETVKTPYSRYNLTLNSATRKPYNRTDLNVAVPPFIELPNKIAFASTASPLIGDFSGKNTNGDSKFRPPSSVNSIHISPGSNTASVVTNGHVSTVVTNSQTNHISGFQPPLQSSMNNIVVLPDSNSASIVATSQLQTTSDNTRRPTVEQNGLDETTKPGIVFFTKGHVTSAEAYDNVKTNRINYRGSVAPVNNNNIVIDAGTNTASFGISSQMVIGNEQPARSNGTQIKFEEETKQKSDGDVYPVASSLSTQRPQGFLLPSTTTKPVNTIYAQSASFADAQQTENQVRFPAEVTADQPVFDSNTDKPIKFPLNPLPQFHSNQAIPIEGGTIIKFNEIPDAIDINNFKQPVLAPANALPVSNYVVFRPPPSIAIQPPVLMAPIHLAEMTRPPAILRNTPTFLVKKPTFVHFARKNFTSLPNILPQFRPSPQPQHIALTPELVNQIRQGQFNRPQFLYNTQTVRFKPTIPFHYSAQRVMTPMQMPNRRHYELYPANFKQRLYDQRIGPHLMQRSPLSANALLVDPQQFEDNMKITVSDGVLKSN